MASVYVNAIYLCCKWLDLVLVGSVIGDSNANIEVQLEV